MAGDAYFDKVSLYLDFATATDNGTNTPNPPQDFKDLSLYGLGPYRTNSTRLRKDMRGLNGSVMEVWNYSSPVGLSFFPSERFAFGSGDFTLELRALIAGGNSTDRWPNIFSCAQFAIRKLDASVGNGYQVRIGASNVMSASSANISPTELTPLMLSRSAGVYRFFVAGVLSATYSGDTSGVLLPEGRIVVGGSGVDTAVDDYARWYGFYDQVRVTKGVARAVASYTPSTTPFPAYAAQFFGNVKDATGANAARVVRAYREDTGAFVGSATSDAGTGNYTINSAYAGVCTLVFYPAAGETTLNAIVLRGVTPV